MSDTSLWKNNAFICLFASYATSMMGRWFDMVAILMLFGYIWDVSPLIMAFIPIAYALPNALLSQFAGIIADRFNKVHLMIYADIGTALLTIALAFTPFPWLALLILLLRATLTVIHFPAQQALIKHIVPEKLLVKAITMTGTANELTKIIGPLAGGALGAVFSPRLCILINALAYLISAIILIRMDKKSFPRDNIEAKSVKQSETFWASWRDGWQTVLTNRRLTVSFLFALLAMTAIQLVDVQLPVLLREFAPDQPELTGWIMAAAGAGAAVMMIILSQRQRTLHYGINLGGSLVLIGCGFGGMSLIYEGMPSYLPLSFGFLAGLGVGLFTVSTSYILQKESTEKTISRISGIYSSLSGFVVLLAPLIGGLLVHLWGASPVYQGVAVALMLIGSTGFLCHKLLWGNTQAQDDSHPHSQTHEIS
ncbi:MFS transporter [Bacillus sp. A301a_S52]|nr:MFS transporter [Bacillus sp. A301a_S52]